MTTPSQAASAHGAQMAKYFKLNQSAWKCCHRLRFLWSGRNWRLPG